jgi:UDP-3-O-[3-hydroxymyristoyl] N-acetylglucosamine deacetylase
MAYSNSLEAVTDQVLAGASLLIVDDEDSIRRSLQCVFEDEGAIVSLASNGDEALAQIATALKASKLPDLVFLDIWMADKDGIATLTEIKRIAPNLPVVMMSGHATIATAMKATRLGADDFIEKPIDLSALLALATRLLCEHGVVGDKKQCESKGSEAIIAQDLPSMRPIAFENMGLSGSVFKQKTIAKSCVLYGHGVHTGQKSGLLLEPLPINSGIHFVGMSASVAVPAHVSYVESTGYATSLKLGETQVSTVEHLMSALCAYGISNLLVKCNGEVPVFDGSSLEFCNLFDDVGVIDQDAPWHGIKLTETVRVGSEKEYIVIEPADTFSVHYVLDYPLPLGRQEYHFTLGDIEAYKREIAPARTFGFVRDIERLQTAGLAQGGRFGNFVLYGEGGTINVDLRFPDEAVRHKILDAIGDLFLLGRPLQGKVTAHLTGHSDNIELLKQIWHRLQSI